MMILKLNQNFKENAKVLSRYIWESKFTFLIPVSNLKKNFHFVYCGLNGTQYYWKKILTETKYYKTFSLKPLFSFARPGYFVVELIKFLIHLFYTPSDEVIFN